MSPVSPGAQTANPVHSPVSPPPPHNNVQGQLPPATLEHKQSYTPASQSFVPPAAPVEVVAELSTNLGGLKLGDSPAGTLAASPSSQHLASNPSAQAAPTPKGSPVPQRHVSASSVPLADPWTFVDPVTETPTREFYILADLLFDALDRNFEPRNSGLLEAPKIVASWIGLPEDARSKSLV